jgi:uncharacterized phiE125 gp8 family phage protein
MTPALITPPAAEPVSLDEAKAFLKLETDADDSLLATLIAAARVAIETRTRRVLVSQAWRLYLDDLPRAKSVQLPIMPLISVDAVTVYDGTGEPIVLPATDYLADIITEPPRLRFNVSAPIDAGIEMNGVEIDFTAGYGDPADVPEPLRMAVLQLVALWYERREPVAFGGAVAVMPQSVHALAEPYRVLTL